MDYKRELKRILNLDVSAKEQKSMINELEKDLGLIYREKISNVRGSIFGHETKGEKREHIARKKERLRIEREKMEQACRKAIEQIPKAQKNLIDGKSEKAGLVAGLICSIAMIDGLSTSERKQIGPIIDDAASSFAGIEGLESLLNASPEFISDLLSESGYDNDNQKIDDVCNLIRYATKKLPLISDEEELLKIFEVLIDVANIDDEQSSLEVTALLFVKSSWFDRKGLKEQRKITKRLIKRIPVANLDLTQFTAAKLFLK